MLCVKMFEFLCVTELCVNAVCMM